MNAAGAHWFLCLTVLIYVSHRLYGLLAYPYWVDEFYTTHVSGLTWTGLFDEIARDRVHLPGFYILLKLWRVAVGDNLLALRLLPFLLSLALFPIFGRLCEQMKLNLNSRNVFLFLIAVNPVLYYHSFFIRMYGAFLLAAVLSLTCFLSWINSGAQWDRRFLGLLLITACGAFLHYSMWGIIGPEALAALIIHPRRRLQSASLLLVPVGLIMPWIVYVHEVSRSNPTFLPWPANDAEANQYLEFFSNQILIVSSKLQPAASGLLVLFAIFLIVASILSSRKREVPDKRFQQNTLLFFLCIAVAPFTGAFLIKKYAFAALPIGSAYFIYSVACLLLLIAGGAAAVPQRLRDGVVFVLLALGMAQGARSVLRTSTHPDPDWKRGAVRLSQLCEQTGPPCQIYTPSAIYYFSLDYYLRHVPPQPGQVVLIGPRDTVSSPRCWIVGTREGVASSAQFLAAKGYGVNRPMSIDADENIWAALASL